MMEQDNMDNAKQGLAVLQAFSLREMVDKVNSINTSNSGTKILKDDIVALMKEEGIYSLVYYR